MKKIFIILICLLFTSSVFAAEKKIKPKKTPLKRLSKQLKNGELIKIQSFQAVTFKNIKEGSYKEHPIEVDALITYPEGDGPFPVLLIVHSSGGAGEFVNEWYKFFRDQQKPLLDMGIATMYLDNFSARGAKDTYRDQSKASIWATYIDVFMALEYLSKQTKVNIKKIGVSGFSRGGNLSLMASEKKLRNILVSKDLYFAAAQPRSPECRVVGMFENPTPMPETKTWLVHGLADNYTLAGPCADLAKKMQANGGDVKIDLREGWHHSFTGNYAVERTAAQQFNKCPTWYTKDDGSMGGQYLDMMIKHGIFKSEDEFDAMTRENPKKAFQMGFKAMKKEKCIRVGVNEGGDHGRKFMPEYLKFWKDNLLN